MYDFTVQKNMLNVSLELLEENNIKDISALGGGTALASYYWNHRFSTDIDIFIYGEEEYKDLLKPNKWSANIQDKMSKLGYKGDFKVQTIYLELALNESEKMQFFDVFPFTGIPYIEIELWNTNFKIETVEEIIAKKINFRCEKGNARDLFDIALSIHKKPDILAHMGRLKYKRIELLFETVSSIRNDKNLKDEYLAEINEMNPHQDFKELSLITIDYLHDFFENYCGAHDMGHTLDLEDYIQLEEYVYTNITN
jgi:predicted nucleotidyltransferase component of viral defense system